MTPIKVVNVIKKYPPVVWERLVDRMPSAQRESWIEALEDLAIQSAWMAAYFEARYWSGCGDQGHLHAMRKSNKIRAKIRKALGYEITPSVTF